MPGPRLFNFNFNIGGNAHASRAVRVSSARTAHKFAARARATSRAEGTRYSPDHIRRIGTPAAPAIRLYAPVFRSSSES